MSVPMASRPGLAPATTAGAGVCAALLGSALVHATVVGVHLSEWLPAGLFFLVLVVVELGLGVASLYAWGLRTAQLVVLTSVGTVAVWGVSRTTGLPFGPADFRMPEAVGVPDLSCCVLELGAALMSALYLARRRGHGPASTRWRGPTRWATTLVVAAAVAVTAWGVQPAFGVPGGHAGQSRHDHP